MIYLACEDNPEPGWKAALVVLGLVLAAYLYLV